MEQDTPPKKARRRPLRRKNTSIKKALSRNPERTIQDIVFQVTLWRKLHHGLISFDKAKGRVCKDRSGKCEKMSLQDAAKTLNMSKKSLDDYLLQIRFGSKFGFDFDKHAKEKVGKLRNYVRD